MTIAVAATLLGGCGRDGSEGGGATAHDGNAQDATPGGGAPPASVRVAEARSQPLQTRWDAIGRLVELRRAIVAAEVSGKVLSFDVQEGDRVVGGQTVLAQIDGVWTKLALEAAEATIRSVQARLDQSKRDTEYLNELSKRGSANIKEVEDARAKFQSDSADLEAAIADRNRFAERVQRLGVKAPFDGVVVSKLTEIGQWVNEGSPIVEIITVGQIDAVIDVPERFISRIKVGDVIPLLIEPLSLETEGKVVAIIPAGSNAARTFPVKIRLDDRDGTLRPGMSVIGYVPMSDLRTHLAVPRDAVQFKPQGTMVWTVGPSDGPLPTAQLVGVTVLFAEGDWFAVEVAPDATLADGQAVIVEGGELLFPGRQLVIQNGKPPAASTPSASMTQRPADEG